MIIRIFALSVLAKPLNNAQIVRGVFCLYTFEHGESYEEVNYSNIKAIPSIEGWLLYCLISSKCFLL